MSVEVVEIGAAADRLWSTAVDLFRGVRHDQHDRFLSDPATVAFVAHDGGDVVGWAWGYRQLRADGDSMLLLYEIEVVESERRQGVGRSLVEAFLELGRLEGHRRMWLLTEADNREAVALYESIGGERSLSDKLYYSWQLR
ncbi:MAG: N-acetyltransferase family protein [Actinomycetota bacterium]